MSKALDLLDIKILEMLGKYGPRNISYIARRLGIPIETTRKRVKRLISQFFITFHANVYHTNLGLKKAFVFANALPGYEEVVFKSLKANDFWLYVGRYFGRWEGCYGIYGIPDEHTKEFEEFVHKLEEAEVVRNLQFFWSTCLYSVNLKDNWFDPKSKSWIFDWDKWIEEIPTEETKLPHNLMDPDDFPIRADYIDILILTELEVNSAVSFRDIAKTINASPEVVSYHYKNHILKRSLLEQSRIFFLRFDRAISDFLVFFFRFDDRDKMARFALSLLDKPFVHALGKIIGENALIVHMYLPRIEFRRLICSLSELIRRGLLESYEYVIEDFNVRAAQTISYEFFEGDSWVYDHAKYVENLKNLIGSAGVGKSRV